MHPAASTVSDWIQSSVTFDKADSSPFHPLEIRQQQQQPLYYDLQQLCMSQPLQNDLDISALPSLIPTTDLKPVGYDTSSIANFSPMAPLTQVHHPTIADYMDSALWPQLNTDSFSLLDHPLTAIDDGSKTQQACTASTIGLEPTSYHNPYSALTAAFPSVTTITPTANITMDFLGSNELSSAFYPWPQLYTQASLANSTISSSPSLSPSSTHTSISPSPCPSSYSLSPSPFTKSNFPARSAFEQHLSPLSVAYKLTPATSSILTRRQSQALLTLNQSSSHPFTSHSNTATPAPSTMSASVSSLTCQVCKKQYANNSTLRRHLKIHAYANSSSHAMSLRRSASINSSSSSVSNSSLIFSTQPTTWPLGMDTSVTSMPPSSMAHGYNPGSDPDIKKPECVGCNKAFARRDTVILHIKNQKRKWDLLSAMLPNLTAVATGVSSRQSEEPESIKDTTTIRHKEESNRGRRRVERRRRSHPYRMVEKLWQSTLQMKGFMLTTTSNNNNLKVKMERSEEDKQNDDGEEMGQGEEEEEEERKTHQQHSGDVEEHSIEAEDDEENDGRSEDGWPSMGRMSKMDSRAKLQWMMKMMVLPPCWKERKVRLFGAFGVLEEKVLQ